MAKSLMLKLNIVKTDQEIDQSWSVERIAMEAPPPTWESVFEDARPELHDISLILSEQERMFGPYYPAKKDIFVAFKYTPLPKVKVVLLGQDPYHQPGRAVGLSFSVRQDDSIPSSLQNIYTELARSVRGFIKPDHGDLREWAKQGVLLLNMCLTVRSGQPGSHGEIWLGFINKVFKAIAAVNPNCIFLLWGREAQKVKQMLGDKSIILETSHPSGLSARKGFFGCDHFNLANAALIRQGKDGINWRISTLAELNSTRVEIPRFDSSKTNKQEFVPVNLDSLPTIIPLKSSSSTTKAQVNDIKSYPDILQVPLPKVSLPSILSSSSTIPVVEQSDTEISQKQHRYKTKPPSPIEHLVDQTPIPPGVPMIPTITFGSDINNSEVISTGMPQIIQPSDKQKTVIPTTPQLMGLPIILPLIN